MSSERKKTLSMPPPVPSCSVARCHILNAVCFSIAFIAKLHAILKKWYTRRHGVCSVWSLMYVVLVHRGGVRSTEASQNERNKQNKSLISHLRCESHLFHFHEHAAESQTHFISPASANKQRRATRGTTIFAKSIETIQLIYGL